MHSLARTFVFAASVLIAAPAAFALDRVKVAVGQGTTFDTAFLIAAKGTGVFEKHGLDVEFLTTSGGGETLQAVISGSVDVGIAAGTTGVMGAFAKGAPVRVLSAQDTGADETFLYVPANSPIRSFSEATGKTVAFSTVGASTYTFVTGLADVYKVKPKFTPTGGIPATYAATMSGQIDIGWAAFPFGAQEQKDGKIRILAWGKEVKDLHSQTIRVNITHVGALNGRKDVLRRFMAAYAEALDWAYASKDAPKAIAALLGAAETDVEATRTNYIVRSQLQMHDILALERSMQDAIEFKYIAAPLTNEQIAELFQMRNILAPK